MADKTKSIKSATDRELDELLIRLRKENEVQNLIGDLKRKSTPNSPFENSVPYDRPEVSTEVPIESLYHKADETLAHFGILGMKWGVRRKPGPNGTVGKDSNIRKSGFTKTEEKIIKSRKNELLNGAISAEMEAEKYAKNNLSDKAKKSLDDYLSAEIEQPDEFFSEMVNYANKYLSDNPDKIPSGLSIKYKNAFENIDWDDGVIHPDYSYNDKPVDFGFKFRPDESDRVFLEAPKVKHSAVEDSLAHFGILGMKWGVRRKPGPNGTVGSGTQKKGSDDYLKAREIKSKGYKNLSTKELQDLTKRMQLEKQLRELTASDYTRGMEAAKAVLAVGTTVASIYALSTTPMGQAVKKAITKS